VHAKKQVFEVEKVMLRVPEEAARSPTPTPTDDSPAADGTSSARRDGAGRILYRYCLL
jgi:hypothetical protein